MTPSGLIGVVHLAPMPGDPRHDGGPLERVLDAAERDAEALVAGGASAMIVENFGSAPFPKGAPEQPTSAYAIAAMTVAAERCARLGVPLGVNVLRNDAAAALSIAAAVGAAFIRVNVHVGAYVTDQGLIEGRAADTLRLRRALDADGIAIWADVRVKHAAPLAERPVADEVGDAVARGLADAVIVTGRGTGQPIDAALLQEVRAAAGDAPVVLGSGVTPDNAAALMAHADAAIVGTWLKEDGVVANPVDATRVRRLVEALARQ